MYVFSQSLIQRSKGLNLGSQPSSVKLCRVPQGLVSVPSRGELAMLHVTEISQRYTCVGSHLRPSPPPPMCVVYALHVVLNFTVFVHLVFRRTCWLLLKCIISSFLGFVIWWLLFIPVLQEMVKWLMIMSLVSVLPRLDLVVSVLKGFCTASQKYDADGSYMAYT